MLKPGASLCVLEITAPAGRLSHFLLRTYMRSSIVPTLCRLVAREANTPKLMRYYWDTIEACVAPEQGMSTLAQAGFAQVERHLEAGVFSEYRAIAGFHRPYRVCKAGQQR